MSAICFALHIRNSFAPLMTTPDIYLLQAFIYSVAVDVFICKLPQDDSSFTLELFTTSFLFVCPVTVSSVFAAVPDFLTAVFE